MARNLSSPDSDGVFDGNVLTDEGWSILAGVTADVATVNDDVDECLGVLQQLLQVRKPPKWVLHFISFFAYWTKI